MLTKSLRSDHERRLLLIQLCDEGEAVAMKRAEIADRLELSQEHADQVVVRPGSAKEFLETPELAKLLISSIPRSEDSPF